jgi:hypothetical protein
VTTRKRRRNKGKQRNEMQQKKKRRLFGFWGLFRKSGTDKRVYSTAGYGGTKSSAYMLQYVKRSDIPLLFQ